MNADESLNRQMDRNEKRRFAADDRALARLDSAIDRAEPQIGMLIREGKEVYYVWPQGGKYREGSRNELISFLIRNGYA